MDTVLIALVALACPLGMGLCIWMMARGMRRGSDTGESDHAERPSLAELRAERDRLTAEIARGEREAGNGADTALSRDAPSQRA